MYLSFVDIAVLILFLLIVVSFSLFKGKKNADTSEGFFLAGRGLSWGIIGISLIAANISTEQFIGMSGSSAGITGLAVAAYEWMPAITLVIVAIFFIPRFLRCGVYTIPEYLEYRYNKTTRTIMAIYVMIVYVGVTLSAVLYSGALALHTIFDTNLVMSVWIIGFVAALYTTYGGLKSVAWADVFQGSALIIGGLSVSIIGIKELGGLKNFWEGSQEKLHMFLPADHPELPWTALLIGLWIPNFYYWGLNQYIMQRTLAAKDLRQSQLGILFAAGIKLIMPLVTIVPGIIAFELYRENLAGNSDFAYPLLIRNLVPTGLKGFILAALAGAVISTLASMLNSASTIFTMDLFHKYINKNATQHKLVQTGRIATLIFVLIACIIAPVLANPKFKGVFHFIQDFQGYISPGILAAFIFGFIIPKTPPLAAILALLLNIPVYGILHLEAFSHISFLNKMAITLGVLVLVMAFITWLYPLKEPKLLPIKNNINIKPGKMVIILGIILISITVSLFIFFR